MLHEWLLSKQESGVLLREFTPQFAPGNQGGDNSIRYVVSKLNSSNVFVVTDDPGLSRSIQNLGIGVLSSNRYLNENLVNGSITPEQYLNAANARYISGNGSGLFRPGEVYQGSNGVFFQLGPDGLTVTDRTGNVWLFGPKDRVLIDDKTGAVSGGQRLERCFLAGTPIEMWDGSTKPIEQIAPKDVVVSYGASGTRKPGTVTRTFQNVVTHILDFWGTGVTPGHVYLCGEGRFAGRHVPLIDILRDDGAVVRSDGTLVRAATNCVVGSLGDRLVWAIAGPDFNGAIKVTDKRQLRLGTRVITPDGEDSCILDALIAEHGPLDDNFSFADGTPLDELVVHVPFGDKLPKPEDYILKRSALALSEIYAANEWESVGPQTSPPPDRWDATHLHEAVLSVAPNIPPAFAHRPDAPRLNRKQRKALAARQRKMGLRARAGPPSVH